MAAADRCISQACQQPKWPAVAHLPPGSAAASALPSRGGKC